MIHNWHYLLDLIFPPTEHELLLRKYNRDDLDKFLKPTVHNEVICLSDYSRPVIQAAITSTKFEHSYLASHLLASLVAGWLNSLPPKNTLLIPIPLSQHRFRERGFNQVTRVLESVTVTNYSARICENLLIRQRDTVPQTSLKRAERLTNLNQAFAVNQNQLAKLAGVERIIICDDVMTTGATLAAARATLAPPIPPHLQVISVAWAH